jgi:hypothetical protein
LADIKTVKRTFGDTVNDVVLAVIAGAFRELLADLDEARTMPCYAPRVRSPSGRNETGHPTNQVVAMVAELPVRIADPLERPISISRQMELLKTSGPADTGQTLTALGGFTAPSVLALALRAATVIGRQYPSVPSAR